MLSSSTLFPQPPTFYSLMLCISLSFALLALSPCPSSPEFFFEVLIRKRPEPLWQLLTKIGLLYALEPIFTVIFVVNMNTIWEKVMSILRAQIFRRVLVQKVSNVSFPWQPVK